MRLQTQKKFVSASDLAVAATLLALLPVALVVPVRGWLKVCRMYARALANFRIAKVIETAAVLSRLQSPQDSSTAAETGYRECLAMTFESRLQIVDQNVFRRWRPDVPVTGKQHIDAALESGRGAILWISPFAFSDLIAKIGLAQAGYELVHLSRPQHGFSDTVVGMATLNGLRTRIENRYLHDRVKIDINTEKPAMLALRRIVRNNGVVGITVGAQTRNPQSVPLGYGELSISSGAIRLAQLTSTPLIPVFAVRSGDLDYRVHVEKPLDTDSLESVGDNTLRALEQYAIILHQYIKRYPFQSRCVPYFSARKQPHGDIDRGD
jgi:lauroyl/myristoyl acyltransferase